MNAWQGFKEGRWTKEIDVRGFIQANYTPYEGDDSFLAGATENTKQLWEEVMELFKKERENGGVLDVDTETVSGINEYAPGYIDQALEKIVEKPSMLKVPIIISRNKIQVGFQEEYIRAFIPRSHRRLQIAM